MIDVEIYDKLTYAFSWLTKTPSSHTPKHRNRSSETKCLRFIFIAHSFERHSRAEDPFLGACVCVCVKNKWVISSQFFASHASTLMFARINTLIVFRIEFAPVHCLYIYFFASFSLRVCVCFCTASNHLAYATEYTTALYHGLRYVCVRLFSNNIFRNIFGCITHAIFSFGRFNMLYQFNSV